MKSFFLVVSLTSLALSVSSWASPTKVSDQEVFNSVAEIHQRLENEGFEKVIAGAKWLEGDDLQAIQTAQNQVPEKEVPRPVRHGRYASIMAGGLGGWDDYCISNPLALGCGGSDDSIILDSNSQSQLRDDGVQILATEVLYQTLTYYKVKHVFGKVKPGVWGFKVIDPVEGGAYQDLDTQSVVYAIKQFRRYVIGLMCNEATPSRMLAVMTKFNVGERFRWDMAWALLGNGLPEAPNKFMKFGPKWNRFAAAMDGIENGSLLRLQNSRGGVTPFDPSKAAGGASGAVGGAVRVGLIAKEIVGIVRLVGDIISQVLSLFCVTDLSVNQALEVKKSQAIDKLLEVKRKAYDRYGPLRSVLEELGKEATAQTGIGQNFLP